MGFVLRFLCQFMSCKNWAFGIALYPECTYFSWAEFDTSKFLFNHGKPRKSHSTVFLIGWSEFSGVNSNHLWNAYCNNIYLVHSFFMNVLSAAKSRGERVVLTFLDISWCLRFEGLTQCRMRRRPSAWIALLDLLKGGTNIQACSTWSNICMDHGTGFGSVGNIHHWLAAWYEQRQLPKEHVTLSSVVSLFWCY